MEISGCYRPKYCYKNSATTLFLMHRVFVVKRGVTRNLGTNTEIGDVLFSNNPLTVTF